MDVTKYLTTTFKFNGRGPKQFDCYGLAMAIYKNELGIELPELTTPELLYDIYVKCDESVQYFTKLEKPEPYCLIAFEIKPPFISHVGIMLPDMKTFIHAFYKSGICVQRIDEPIWKNKLRGFYTYANSKD